MQIAVVKEVIFSTFAPSWWRRKVTLILLLTINFIFSKGLRFVEAYVSNLQYLPIFNWL